MSADRLPFRIVPRHAKVRLLCLPFAGGSAAVFRRWPRALPDWIDVCPVEFPGRGSRFTEDPLTSMKALVDDLLRGLRPLLDRPVALFGHSMGARVAREVARELGHRVVHVFASASPAPHIPVRRRRARLSDDEIVHELRRLGGTRAEVFDEPELLDAILPAVRADFAVLDGYIGTSEPPLECPVTVFLGTADPEVSAEQAGAWQGHTRGPCEIVELDAGHFFIEQEESRLLQVVVERLGAGSSRLRSPETHVAQPWIGRLSSVPSSGKSGIDG